MTLHYVLISIVQASVVKRRITKKSSPEETIAPVPKDFQKLLGHDLFKYNIPVK